MSPLAAALAVAVGSAVGALARWQAGVWFNPIWAGFPLGTLFVNALGGLLIGLAFAWLDRYPSEVLRLLLVTGGLGGFTTFSAFSAESLALLERGRFELALAHTLAHVVGALACAALGARLMRAWMA
ncbi:fluoride efflux transporter CrcB [Aquabacterium sp.]|uniref:fluoride efflux transporter CrcB n=1 Tax=Aquabacterium sp. TaxID=1872578 RepID=UPI002487FB85|nr:fluoride efflux transporter CrcB [Aquabacterium sp.]MDI1349407.1 fluoride efflux transporter CrcB [Aquabacterium sp.]